MRSIKKKSEEVIEEPPIVKWLYPDEDEEYVSQFNNSPKKKAELLA